MDGGGGGGYAAEDAGLLQQEEGQEEAYYPAEGYAAQEEAAYYEQAQGHAAEAAAAQMQQAQRPLTRKKKKRAGGKRRGGADSAVQTMQVVLCGTEEDAKLWLINSDVTGIVLSSVVWACLLYADYVILCIVLDGDFALVHGVLFSFFSFLALYSHAKTMFTDPGTVPSDARPISRRTRAKVRQEEEVHGGTGDEEAGIADDDGEEDVVCGRCESYKPTRAHHCRICNRCIVRMDHHCPWMNNCVGAGNQKHFLLFLFYSVVLCLYCLGLLLYHLIRCKAMPSECEKFSAVDRDMIRVLIAICIFSLLFTGSMLINQVYGIVTGIGTIDRMKMKKGARIRSRPVPFRHVFGDGPIIFAPFPLDIVLHDPESALEYRRSKRKAMQSGASYV